MTRRIALLGLSGVGKSTLVAQLNLITPVLHLQASELIKEEQAHRALQPSASEALRKGNVLDNQLLLIAAFHRKVASTAFPIVFDGHSIIDGRDGIVEIPSDVFRALDLDAVCFLSADPIVIAKRRLADTARERPTHDVETLKVHQNIAVNAARRIAAEINRRFVLVEDGRLSRLREMLS